MAPQLPTSTSEHETSINDSAKSGPVDWRKKFSVGATEWNEWRRATSFTPLRIHGAFLADMAGLQGIDLSHCDLGYSDLRWNNLSGASFEGAELGSTDLSDTKLDGANFAGAKLSATIFGGNNLSKVVGLDQVVHRGPSVIGVQTLLESGNTVPDSFYLGAGVPQSVIDYVPSLAGAVAPIQFQSCFISYSTVDEAFARRLHERMRAEGLRVWFAPEDIQGGKRLFDQIEQAIHVHDRLLLVLSEASMASNWVATEVRNARIDEVKENRQKLFPIRIVPFDRVQAWSRKDADRGVDLAAEVRDYFIPDFSNWKDHDSFEDGFGKLLRDLRGDA